MRGVLVVVWVLFGVSAAHGRTSANNTLDLPFGKLNKLSSPDGQYMLYGQPYGRGTNTPPELWIENTGTSARTRVLQLGGTARAAWSADGTAFYVNDRFASDSTRSYLYEASTLKRIDIGNAILGVDREAVQFAKGHAYFEVDRWEGSQDVLIRFYGHTDEAPVVCFDFRYKVNRAGVVTKLSRRTSRVTAAGCGQ